MSEASNKVRYNFSLLFNHVKFCFFSVAQFTATSVVSGCGTLYQSVCQLRVPPEQHSFRLIIRHVLCLANSTALFYLKCFYCLLHGFLGMHLLTCSCANLLVVKSAPSVEEEEDDNVTDCLAKRSVYTHGRPCDVPLQS